MCNVFNITLFSNATFSGEGLNFNRLPINSEIIKRK